LPPGFASSALFLSHERQLENAVYRYAMGMIERRACSIGAAL
jgi:hypothetical protein